jgi:hypothetical protein
MGTTVDNIHLSTDEPVDPEVLRTIFSGAAAVTRPLNGWVTVFPESGGPGGPLPAELSAHLGLLVVAFWTFDDDYATAELFRNGELITTLNASTHPWPTNEFEGLLDAGGFDGTVEEAAEMTGMTVEELLHPSSQLPLFEDIDTQLSITGEAQPLAEALRITPAQLQATVEMRIDESSPVDLIASILETAGISRDRTGLAYHHISWGGHDELGELTTIG